MKTADIVLVQGRDGISAGIEFFSRGGYSHAALAASEDDIIEAVPEGVIETAMHYDHYGVFRVIGITDEECKQVIDYARRALVGTPYDYDQDAGFAVNAFRELIGLERIPNLFDKDGKLICSATVDMAFRGGINLLLRPDRQPGDITPTGLSYSLLIRMIENHNLWDI